MRFIIFLIILISLVVIFIKPTSVNATSVCSGTFQCIQETYSCPSDCPGVAYGCCTQTNVTITESCGFITDQSSCSGSTANAVCTNIYSPSAGIQNFNCSWQNDACTVDSQCGNCGRCCAGSPNYCRTDGYTCGGAPISGCISTPTPTPVPQTCTPNEFISGTHCISSTSCYDIYCNSSGTGTVNRTYSGDTCSSCGSGSSATPVPTTTSGGGGCGLCNGVECCEPSVCTGAPLSCYSFEPPPGGCWIGSDPYGTCQGSACVQVAGCGFSSCFSDVDCSCGDNICQAYETASCPSDCTKTLTGRVYYDLNNNQVYESTSETGVSNPQLTLFPADYGNFSRTTDGRYTFSQVPIGNHTLTLTLPSGYRTTVTNPVTLPMNSNTTYDFPLVPPPACVPGSISANSTTVNPGQSTQLSVTSCTNVENPNDGSPPPPITWNPDNDPGNTRPDPTINPTTPNPTCAFGSCSSTTTWTAPSCPTSTYTYQPQVTLAGPGGTTTYQTPSGITVPATYSISVNVRSVTSDTSCLPTDGVAYQDPSSGTGATVNARNTSTGTNYGNRTTGSGIPGTTYTCLPSGGGTDDYQISLQSIPGYSIVRVNNNGSQTSPGSSPVTVLNLNSDRTVTFCIAPIDPWFQTTTGNVRYVNLSNPVPVGEYGSKDPVYPGIFYSSASTAEFGLGGRQSSSTRQWVVNNEYSFNSNTQNRNGGMSYDFYKAKALQDGVTITQITPGTLNQSEITGTGVYESNGNLTINSYTHVNGTRVVLLVNGNVTINTPITIPVGQGLFIVAAKGNITISGDIGTSTLSSTTTHLDGFYTAQGSIILSSRTPNLTDRCTSSGVDDRRLNVGGGLIANSLKPFATAGGSIQNNRTLCINNLNYPVLYIAQRPDFLVQMTDFYKTSYTKWQEVNP